MDMAFGTITGLWANLPIPPKPSIIKLEKPLKDDWMRGYLINKNLCFYYWLRKRIGKERAFCVVKYFETVILLFGREPIRQHSLTKNPECNYLNRKRISPM
jgi:hypothetical protein